MKKIILLLALIACACSSSFEPAKKAERLVWQNYRDCEKIIMIDVDTVTLGDNLNYRIEQQKGHIKYAESEVRMYQGYIREFKQYGASAKSMVAGYQKDLHKADSTLKIEKLRLAALDSLKHVTLDIADTPAAYEICVAYNYPNNLVWIQLDADGTFLKMSKNKMDMLLNPGAEMPGYFDIYKRFSSLR